MATGRDGNTSKSSGLLSSTSWFLLPVVVVASGRDGHTSELLAPSFFSVLVSPGSCCLAHWEGCAHFLVELHVGSGYSAVKKVRQILLITFVVIQLLYALIELYISDDSTFLSNRYTRAILVYLSVSWQVSM